MPDSNIEILKKETYLKAIENSVGSKLFRSLFVRRKDSGKVEDILDEGEYSCSFFVSNILFLFGALEKPHATVKGLREKLDERTAGTSDTADWQKIATKDALSGDVIFYEKYKFKNGTEHAHVGFILNSDEAVSTNSEMKCVGRHPINNRPIEAVYRFAWA